MEQILRDFAEAISPALQTLLEAAFVVIAGQISLWLKQQYDLKRSELGDKERWYLDNLVEIGIMAAEQLYESGEGDKKKAYALEFVEKQAEKVSLKIDLDVVAAMVEAKVHEYFSERG